MRLTPDDRLDTYAPWIGLCQSCQRDARLAATQNDLAVRTQLEPIVVRLYGHRRPDAHSRPQRTIGVLESADDDRTPQVPLLEQDDYGAPRLLRSKRNGSSRATTTS